MTIIFEDPYGFGTVAKTYRGEGKVRRQRIWVKKRFDMMYMFQAQKY